MQEDMVEKFTEFLVANDRIANDCKAVLPLARDPDVIKAFDFLCRLDVLSQKYQFQPSDIILLLDPSYTPDYKNDSNPKASNQKRQPRQMKCYRNPHTGEVITTRGANHKVLKQWKAAHGAETVAGWLEPSSAL